MRYHIDTSAQSLAIYTLTDLADGTINLNDGICGISGKYHFDPFQFAQAPFSLVAGSALATLSLA